MCGYVWGGHLLRRDAVQFGRSLPTFRRDILAPSSGSQIKPSKKQATRILWNIGEILQDYAASRSYVHEKLKSNVFIYWLQESPICHSVVISTLDVQFYEQRNENSYSVLGFDTA
jgi:hypothetical protein